VKPSSHSLFGGQDKVFLNSLFTFCYLSAEGNTLGQFVDSQLAVKVGLLGCALHANDDSCYHHAGGEEGPGTVDDDLQVDRRGQSGRFILHHWAG